MEKELTRVAEISVSYRPAILNKPIGNDTCKRDQTEPGLCYRRRGEEYEREEIIDYLKDARPPAWN